jgi:hypothetical protein
MIKNNPKPDIKKTTSVLVLADRWVHFLARIGINRNKHRVDPGLYTLGHPTTSSPVFVTANYTLSFDALRSSLIGVNCYILVLDTKGINVWCAAGKGTFGTDELVNRIEVSSLNQVVTHRKIILPQLGAPGVAAHDIQKRTGFHVEYGPVLARDIPEYLKTHKATLEMRQVTFDFKNRLLLIPVEVVSMIIPLIAAAIILFFVSGLLISISVTAAILAGVILFPFLLPWIPTHNFSTKGFILGGIVALPFALSAIFINPDSTWWQISGWALAYLLVIPPITAFLSLNFTGATTFTSRSGVKREIYRYIPIMAWSFGSGLVLLIIFTLI